MNFVTMLVETMLALGLVCGLAYLVFHFALPRLNTARSGNSMVRVVDRVGLDPRKSLYVVEVAGRWLLIGASEAGVHLVSELDAKTAEVASDELVRRRAAPSPAVEAARRAFADRLARLMNKRGD
jgi:flagellar protein FliO/FliZ